MTTLRVHDYEAKMQADDYAAAIAIRVAELLAAAIEERGTATLAVSGGRSPIPVFRALSEKVIPWKNVWVTLVDERWVATDSSDSNERLVRENLLLGPASAAQFLGLKTTAGTPADALADRDAALSSLPLPFDVIMLGMGEDGHTASLFPGAAGLAAALDPAAAALLVAIDPPNAPHRRISLSLSGLLRSRNIVLAIGGSAKRAIYERALRNAAVLDLPIAAVLRQDKAPVDVYIG